MSSPTAFTDILLGKSSSKARHFDIKKIKKLINEAMKMNKVPIHIPTDIWKALPKNLRESIIQARTDSKFAKVEWDSLIGHKTQGKKCLTPEKEEKVINDLLAKGEVPVGIPTEVWKRLPGNTKKKIKEAKEKKYQKVKWATVCKKNN
jgi:hypothetical protein